MDLYDGHGNITELSEDVNKLKGDLSHYVNPGEFSVEKTFIGTDGIPVTNDAYTNWASTDYVEVKPSNKLIYKLYVSNNFASIAFYSENRTFISAVKRESSAVIESESVIPNNARYYRASKAFNYCPDSYVKQVIDDTKISQNTANIEKNTANIEKNTANIEKNTANIEKNKIENTIDVEFTKDGYLEGLGNFVGNPVAKVSDYIEISSGDKIYLRLYSNDTATTKLSNKIGLIVFYNSSKKVISVFYETGVTGMYEGIVTAPDDASYYRSCKWNGHDDDSYCYTKISLLAMHADVKQLKEDARKLSAVKYKYGDSLLKPFDFNGKTAIAFGDSITAGVANEGSGNIGAGSSSYINVFASQVGLTLTNRAVSGSTITYADGETLESLYTRIMAMTETPDFIIISGGTNDYNQGKELGSFGDTHNTNFYGALYQICEKLKSDNSNSIVIFITPINITKDFNGYGRVLLNNYRNAIYEVATSYGFNVVNGADLVPVTGQTGYDDTIISHVDGCHPTIKGHGLYAKNLCGKLL